MIGPSPKRHDLYRRGAAYYVPRGMVADLPERAELDQLAEVAAEKLGIRFEHHEPAGAYFVLPLRAGGKREMEREHLYALVPLAELRTAPSRFVAYLHEQRGTGSAWTLGGRVGFVDGDHGFAAVNIDGVRHLLMRMYVVHENSPERWRPPAPAPDAEPASEKRVEPIGGEVEEAAAD